MSELNDLLEGKETEEEAPDAPEQEVVEEEATDEAQEDGEPEPEEAEAKEETEEKPKAKRESKSVPLAAFLEVQRKLEARLAEAEKKAAEFEAKSKATPDYSSFIKKAPDQIPSVYDDEQGHTEALRQAQNAELANIKFNISLDNALATFGNDRVNEAMSAFQQAAQNNPMLRQAAEASYNPVREIVQWHETQQKLSYADKLQADQLRKLAEAGGLDAYEKSLRAQIEAEFKAKMNTGDDDGDEDEAPAIRKQPTLPSNFNRGGKGGNKETPRDTSLDALLA